MPLDPEKLRFVRENIPPRAKELAIEYLDMVKDNPPQREWDRAFAYVMEQVVMYDEKDLTTSDVSKKDTPTTLKGRGH